MEKACEYNVSMYMAFIDDMKAFDSVSYSTLWTMLRKMEAVVDLVMKLYNR